MSWSREKMEEARRKREIRDIEFKKTVKDMRSLDPTKGTVSLSIEAYPKVGGEYHTGKRKVFSEDQQDDAISYALSLVKKEGAEYACMNVRYTYSDDWDGVRHPGFFGFVNKESIGDFSGSTPHVRIVNILGPVKFPGDNY